MERIMVIMGTRPEAIKLCPLVHELKKRKRFEVLICSTGQHRSMLDSVLRAFTIKPDFDLDVMRTGQTLSSVTARILKGLDETGFLVYNTIVYYYVHTFAFSLVST